MPPNALITFDGLRRRIGGSSLHPTKRVAEAKRVIEYLQNLGHAIASADDVLTAIEADLSEEELSAFRCVEGVAVAHASDGWWLLFRHGEVELTGRATFDETSSAIEGQV